MTRTTPVPADPSSSIPAALTRLTDAEPHKLQDADGPHLLAYLAAVPDPRAARGRRHPLVAILAMAAAAVLAGARSIAAIAEWAADAPQPVRVALGARRDAPDHFAVPAEATIRRTLARLDADALAGAVSAWLADRDPDQDRPRPAAGSRCRAVAVDGKTLRGARTRTANGEGRPVHLLAAMDHTSRAVLAQQQVGGAPEEVPAFAPLWPHSTSPGPWSPPTRCRPTRRPPSSWCATSGPTTYLCSRPTSPPC
jgi:DDE_Tnp_1-associated